MIPALRLALFLVAALAWASPSPVRADDQRLTDLTERRDTLESTMRQLREERDMVQTLLDEDRVYTVPLPFIEQGPLMHLVNRDTALRSLSVLYMMQVVREDRPYDAEELARHLRRMRDAAADLRHDLEGAVAALEEEEARWLRELARIETDIAELRGATSGGDDQGPTSGGNGPCVELVRVERRGELGEVANAAIGAEIHSIAWAAQTDHGFRTDLSVDWTAPPLRICAGERIRFTMNARNNSVNHDTTADSFAYVSLNGTTPHSCSNPPRVGQSERSAAVAPDETAHSNSCVFEPPSIGDWSAPRVLFHANLWAFPASGRVSYLYQ